MSTICAIRGTCLLVLATLAFAIVLSAGSYAKADEQETIAVKCRPGPITPTVVLAGVVAAGNSAKISLKCDDDVKVELSAKTEGQTVKLSNCNPDPDPALADDRGTIKFRCDVEITLSTKDDHGQPIPVTCKTNAKVEAPEPPNRVTIKPECVPNVKVELVAKVDQNEKVTTLKCDTDPTVGPPTAGTSVPITLKQCEIGVKVKVEPAKQTEWTLSCDPGVPEATYVLDEQANTVTYRNPKIPLEQTVAKKCPQKKCDPRESSLIYCETWKAQFDKHVVDWIRCDTDAGTPGSNDDQKDEVTLDLQTGLMRQRFIGKAVQGMADRTWKCKVVKPKLITAQNAKDGPTVETSTTKKDGEVTTTIKVTTKKDSPADQ